MTPDRDTAAVPAPMPGPGRATILTAGLVGLENQALGLAEAAGLDAALRRFRPRGPQALLPAAWWPRPLAAADGLDGLDRAEGALITAGGAAAAIGAALRARGRRPVICVQDPRMRLDRFDLVIANRHDGIDGPNVVVTRTALHRASPSALAAARAAWRPRLDRLLAPAADGFVALLVGGSNGRHRLDPDTAGALGTALAAAARARGLAVAATPSRRTSPEAVRRLREALAPAGGWIWDGTGDNPYLGLLACARMIVATADSVSMVSEAVATAAPVMVARLPGRSRRIERFLALLRAEGRIRPFEGALDPWPATPLDDTARAAAEMRARLRL